MAYGVDEIVTILSYRRNVHSWVCTECETENQMEHTTCSVCGLVKHPNAKILLPWELEQRFDAENASKKEKVKKTEKVYYEQPADRKSPVGKIFMSILLMAVIAACVYVLLYTYNN